MGPFSRMWYNFSSAWTYEPWSEWIAGHGVNDNWSERLMPDMWQRRIFGGLDDYMAVHIACPSFVESFASMAFQSQAWEGELDDIARAAAEYEVRGFRNS